MIVDACESVIGSAKRLFSPYNVVMMDSAMTLRVHTCSKVEVLRVGVSNWRGAAEYVRLWKQSNSSNSSRN